MFLTEIKNVGKPDVEIDVKYSNGIGQWDTDCWPYPEKHLIEKNIYMKIYWYL